MIDSPATDSVTSLLVRYLDTQSLRAQVVSTNIANADTPGFRAKEVDFAEYLRRAAYEAVNPNAPDALFRAGADGPKLVEQLGNAIGIDGNTVDLGREMATLADAGGQYMTGIQLLQGRFRTLRTAIREGR